MGAQQSVNLSCVVDRLTHAPGENVKGSVFVQVNEEQLSRFEGVTVTLAGVECLTIPESGEIIPGTRKITITQDITHFENGKISKGEYEFPFSLALPYDPITPTAHTNKKELKYSSTLPALVPSHTKSDSMSSEESEISQDVDDDDMSTVSDPTNAGHLPKIHHKQIMYQIKASLKRKPGVPITVDTDFRCKARSASTIVDC